MNSYYFWVPIVGPIIGAIIGVWIFEGYLLLMKKYANLPGITHIDSIEQPSQNEQAAEKPRRSIAPAATESKSSFFFLFSLCHIFFLSNLAVVYM